MCEYLSQIHQACQEFAEQGVSFDILQIRDRVRELTGPGMEVLFKPVKYEVLAFFEQGGIPGFVLTTKRIVQPVSTFWQGEPSDVMGTERTVFNIVPLTTIIDGITPDTVQVSIPREASEAGCDDDPIGPMPW